MDDQSIDTNIEKEWSLNFHGNSYMIDILSQGNHHYHHHQLLPSLLSLLRIYIIDIY
jgi:hypothetical protein